MKYELSMRDRYFEILFLCNISRKEFCEIIGIRDNVYTRFINNNQLTSDISLKIHELGINSTWLLTGKGEKFVDNIAGNRLKELVEENEPKEENLMYYKISLWIKAHFYSIENFEEVYDIKEKNYFELIRNSSQLPYDLCKIFKDEGFNLAWLYHNTEIPYMKSVNGLQKKKWILNYKDKECYIYQCLKENK